MHSSAKSGVILQIVPDFYFMTISKTLTVEPDVHMNC
jgi:hypothetical protein